MILKSLMERVMACLTDFVFRKFTGTVTVRLHFRDGGVGKVNVISESDLNLKD